MKASTVVRNRPRTTIRGACVVLAVWGALSASTATALPCEKSALDQYRADVHEVVADYWTARATADHIRNKDERMAAVQEAATVRDEELDEALAKYEARLELCADLGEIRYHPVIDPANFDGGAVNPYLPLTVGTIMTYQGETEDGTETIVIEVTGDTREILGVECVVVHDEAYLDGELIEDTYDYYATDDDGNVWYFGENTAEYEDGYVLNTNGLWIAGEDGAKPGIVMLGDPHIGDIYRQEFASGEAEDAAEVLANNRDVTVPAGMFSLCLKTADFTPVEPDALEYKLYAPGVGLVKEVNPETNEVVRLISIEN